MESDWLDPLRAAASAGGVLVLCRTAATVRAVQRALLGDDLTQPVSWAGLEVTTLPGLLARLVPRHLGASPRPLDDALPPGHPWADLLAERSKLRRTLRRHVQRARGVRLVGVDLTGLRPELAELVDSDWQADDVLAAAERLLRGDALPIDTTVFAVGFGGGRSRLAGQVGPLERALLVALVARHLGGRPGDQAPPGALPAWLLPDVAAEARAVADLVRRSGGTVNLVLVPDASSEERIRAALRRNGLTVTQDGSSPLSRHSLTALLAPLVPVFASRGEAPVTLAALRRLLTSAILSSRPPADGIEPVPGVDQARAGARRVHELLTGCRLLRATLAEWVVALEQIEAVAAQRHEDATADRKEGAARALAAARVVLARVRTVRRHAEGRGTLGELAACVGALGLSDPAGDRVGRATVQALWESAHQPCDEELFEEALAGAVSSGRLEWGVQILELRHYDGRPCDLLVLAGVHDKGLAKPPRPDPLLGTSDLAVLDLPTPAQAIDERIDLVRWAASRAGRVVALCPETGADGRRVGRPVGLDLTIDPSRRRHSHGLGFDLPRLRDADALGEGEGSEDHATRQVDAEWVRHGAAFTDARAEFDPAKQPLSDYLDAFGERHPDALQPWLGAVGDHPGRPDGLPGRFVLSASRAAAFTQCLYRAFAQQIVGLKAREDVSEDLDSMEIGNAVHATLERSMKAAMWVVPDADLEAARAELLQRLLAMTGAAVEEVARSRSPVLDPEPVRVAREGLVGRWERHWRRYVRSRIVPVTAANDAIARAVADRPPVKGPRWDVVSAMFPAGPGRKSVRGQLYRGLGDALAATRGDLAALRASGARITGPIRGAKNAQLVRDRLALDPPMPELVRLATAMRAAFAPLAVSSAGDLEVVEVERSFGRPWDQPDREPLFVELGREPLEVRGYIDALVRRAGRSDQPARLRIVDFKAGRGRPGKREQVTRSLVRPQLAFYALAVDALDAGFDTDGPAEVLSYDQVRNLQTVDAPFDAAGLERARGVLGALVDKGRDGEWSLLPHPDGCPVRNGGRGFCDVKEICRLRPSFAPEDQA